MGVSESADHARSVHLDGEHREEEEGQEASEALGI